MSAGSWLPTVGGVLALAVVAAVVVGSPTRRSWARTPRGRSWARYLGALGAVLVALAAGSFSVWPPAGIYVLAVAGVLAFLGGVLAAAGALAVALAAAGEGATLAARLRAFWYAAAVRFRATRSAFGVALLAFGVAAIVAGVTVDPVLRAVGALSLGGVVACLLALAAAGVFVPGGYDESVAESVRAAS
ncbi:hypothetical protein [Halobacterium yunchengense]|uniref:hypothetical protein n=1 Tax=Halobacterium yunchengense TaxID=3108497 RepID=UPI00300A711E